MDRRDFIKTMGVCGIGMGLASVNGSRLLAAEAAKGAPNAERLGWRLGYQSYTFNQYTFFEAIDKVASLGLHYIEAAPGQQIGGKMPGNIDAGMSPQSRKAVLKKLADSGVKLVGIYGGYDRKQFEFAKEMGIEIPVSEPGENDFDSIGKLCDEFGINLAIHNHPKPSTYWNPETVLKACKGRSKRIGACADTGHWSRSGLNPIECLKKLEGRIVSLHFKDLNQPGHDAHDVPWGTGVCNAKAMLAELHRQKLDAVVSIEYEHNWTTSLPEIARCVEFFGLFRF